jgi:polar amino acid transport system substrate-binding protein
MRKPFKITLVSLLTYLGIASFPTSILAAEGLPPICPQVIDFALIPDGIGTSQKNINRDILVALEAETGCRFRVLNLPFARADAELRTGKVHMSARFFETPERLQYLWFAHFQRTKTYAVSQTQELKLNEWSQLTKDPTLRIGTVRGFIHGDAIDQMLNEVRSTAPLRISEFRDRQVLFEALLSNRVQIIFLPSSIVHVMTKEAGLSDTALSLYDPDPAAEGRPGGLVMSKAFFKDEQAAYWQSAVQRICENGTVLRIFQKYFPANASDVSCMMK